VLNKAISVKMPDTGVTIQSLHRERRRPEPEPVELAVLYEDDAVLALDKPPGLVVHPTYKNTSGTLLNGVLWRYRDRPEVQPGILTRLDKGTSGVVIVALSADLHAAMQRDAAAGRVVKEYIAVVEGTPQAERGTIALPLARDVEDRRRVVVSDGGAPCTTRYEVMREGTPNVDRDGSPAAARSVLRCELITGRTHQIRVHLAAIGCPVVGDPTYGRASEDIARQALHAWRVSLPHPTGREILRVEAPVAPDIAPLLAEN
jgi:23S rRNA pseudouridine1911/1915/1917 synthase